MKKIITAVCLLLSLCAHAQSKYYSDVSFDNNRKPYSCSIKILFQDPRPNTSKNAKYKDAPTGYVIMNDLDGKFSASYSVKYLKTEKDEGSIQNWYVIIDHNEKFNMIMITKCTPPLLLKHKKYNYIITFSKYGSANEDFPLLDRLEFLCH